MATTTFSIRYPLLALLSHEHLTGMSIFFKLHAPNQPERIFFPLFTSLESVRLFCDSTGLPFIVRYLVDPKESQQFVANHKLGGAPMWERGGVVIFDPVSNASHHMEGLRTVDMREFITVMPSSARPASDASPGGN